VWEIPYNIDAAIRDGPLDIQGGPEEFEKK